jgi:hypothetical protein
MTRHAAVLVVVLGLAACSYQRDTVRAVSSPTVDGRTVTTPGAVPSSTRDTRQGGGRPL